MKKTLLYGFIFITLVSVVNAQTAYNMPLGTGGTIANSCGGIFYDSGGSGGKYGNNEDDSVTFCAPAGQYITFTFSSFNTESDIDFLNIYNGSTSGSPLLGSYSGTTTPTGIASSLGGCLTFVFTSDNSVTKAGWAANITCSSTPPPPPPPPPAGGACSSANPFCTSQSYTFPNSTSDPDGLGEINCLFSTPNPIWYFMQIGTAGTVVIHIVQTGAGGPSDSLDVDFNCFGPFTDMTTGCSQISAGTAPNADCSYSANATEYCTITNAVVGQYYALLLTNFSDEPGTISFNSTGASTGATNCNIINCGVTATNTGPYCVGSTISLNAATTNTTATTYAWAGPGGYTATGQNVTIPNATLAMSGTYSVTGTTGGTVTCVETTTVTVTTGAVPTVTSATICAGSPGTLTATGTATSYTWSTGATTAAMTDSPVTTTVYTVTGAVGTCTAAATGTITVITAATSTPTVSSATICAGSPGTLTATGPATSYTWNTGATTAAMTDSPVTTTVYTVTGSVGTCTSAATGTITVVTADAAATPTVTPITICAGSPGTLTAGGAATSYTWSTGATTAAMTASPLTTTVYTVTGSIGTCTAAATATITVVTYTNTATPIVASATICEGNAGTLTATGAASSYTWSTGVTTATMTDNPVATTGYTVTGSVSTCTASATATITVVANPSITVNSATICMGNSVGLMANGATTYNWAPPTGLSNTVLDTVTASPQSLTVYTVTGAVGTCTAMPATATVTLISAITPTLTSNTPCQAQTLSLTCTPTYTNYAWTGPGGFTSSVQNPTEVAVPVSGSGTYTVVVTDANGCVNKATVNTTVNPTPFVSVSTSAACLYNPISLSATPTTYTAYLWIFPSGTTTSTATNPNLQIPNASLSDAGTYHVLVTDNNGCQGANTTPIQVIVYNPPTITVNDITLCLLTPGTLMASSTNPGTTYNWNPQGDLNNNTGNSVIVTPSSLTTTMYTVTGQDANGCINTAIATVSVNAPPTVSILPATIQGCTPQCVTYTPNITNANAYSWSFGNGQTSILASPTACFSIAGTYAVKLTLTDANQCKNTATASVITYPIPAASFNYTPDPATILEPTITFLNATSSTYSTTYSWNFGDSLGTGINVSNLTNPQHTYLNIGTYPVTLIALSANGCSDTIVRNVIIEQDFVLFVPNAFSPNGDGKNETFKAEGEGILSFKMYIFDRWGNNVFASSDIDVGWDGRRNDKGGEVLQNDVYVWKIDLQNVNNQGKTYTGTVTLLK